MALFSPNNKHCYKPTCLFIRCQFFALAFDGLMWPVVYEVSVGAVFYFVIGLSPSLNIASKSLIKLAI